MGAKKSILQLAKKVESRNRAEREAYANYTELGICTSCRKQPALDNDTHCYDCKELRQVKFYPHRDEETKVSRLQPKERKAIVVDRLRANKVLFKEIINNQFLTPKGNKFITATITFHMTLVTRGMIYRIRNEIKRECDFYVAYFPKNDSVYVIPVEEVKPIIYFTIDEIEKFKDDYRVL